MPTTQRISRWCNPTATIAAAAAVVAAAQRSHIEHTGIGDDQRVGRIREHQRYEVAGNDIPFAKQSLCRHLLFIGSNTSLQVLDAFYIHATYQHIHTRASAQCSTMQRLQRSKHSRASLQRTARTKTILALLIRAFAIATADTIDDIEQLGCEFAAIRHATTRDQSRAGMHQEHKETAGDTVGWLATTINVGDGAKSAGGKR
jgi:hypothetical protein